jgi:hypothetical protein
MAAGGERAEAAASRGRGSLRPPPDAAVGGGTGREELPFLRAEHNVLISSVFFCALLDNR